MRLHVRKEESSCFSSSFSVFQCGMCAVGHECNELTCMNVTSYGCRTCMCLSTYIESVFMAYI